MSERSARLTLWACTREIGTLAGTCSVMSRELIRTPDMFLIRSQYRVSECWIPTVTAGIPVRQNFLPDGERGEPTGYET